MNVKLENYLCKRFSPFFEGKDHSFDCSDGWFFILNWAFLRVERSLKYINEEKAPEDKDSFIVLQTKEKFDHIMNNGKRAQNAGVSGVPSFYINGRNYNNELDAINLISLVEKMIERGTSDFTDLN